ncbi:ATP-binding protein [Ornithinibacillus sp. JPR2-1]|uniref:ATP-binding protein n=1 Tax=Ornithinibacillus sp. JPR2-1 TaxID=2094019 RepID=UPI0031E0A749
MTTGFTDLGSAMEQVMERARAMQKRSESLNHQNEQYSDVECKDCKDTGSLIERIYDEDYGFERDVYRPCHCQETKHLKNRFKNALIPSEFKNARFDNYVRESEAQQTLFRAIQEYLREFPNIIENKPEHNSLAFMAVFGESRIKALFGEDRHQAKAERNNFGLGKTHLQMAAAKWMLNKVRVRDELAHGQKSKFERGCRVLCVSDVEFMNELINAKRMNDEGETLNKLLNSAINVDVLVWDDLGKVKWSEAKEDLYYQIINERYRHHRPIMFSSNEDTGSLAEKIGYAACSRLLGMCGERIYEVEGEDYRMRRNH